MRDALYVIQMINRNTKRRVTKTYLILLDRLVMPTENLSFMISMLTVRLRRHFRIMTRKDKKVLKNVENELRRFIDETYRGT